MTAQEHFFRDAESILREWGAHWRARKEGNPLENVSKERDTYLGEGGNQAESEALKVLHPRMTTEEARETLKYAPMPRNRCMSPREPGMPDLESSVSRACAAVGESLWESFKSETGWSDKGPHQRGLVVAKVGDEVYGQLMTLDAEVPHSDFQGKVMSRLGVRFLIRQVYVCQEGLRNWKGSSFDWLYPYAIAEKDRRSHGREATIKMVKSCL